MLPSLPLTARRRRPLYHANLFFISLSLSPPYFYLLLTAMLLFLHVSVKISVRIRRVLLPSEVQFTAGEVMQAGTRTKAFSQKMSKNYTRLRGFVNVSFYA
jgi:hypothetical protein